MARLATGAPGSRRQAHRHLLASALSVLAKLVLEPHDLSLDAVDGQDFGSSRRIQAQKLGSNLFNLKDAINCLEEESVVVKRLIIIISDDAAV